MNSQKYKKDINKKIKSIIKNGANNLIKTIKRMPRKVKIIASILLILILIIIIFSIYLQEESKQKYIEYNGNNLKESKYPGYKELIDELQEKHPNWSFTLFYTRYGS